jgi:hypothetical protein
MNMLTLLKASTTTHDIGKITPAWTLYRLERLKGMDCTVDLKSIMEEKRISLQQHQAEEYASFFADVSCASL